MSERMSGGRDLVTLAAVLIAAGLFLAPSFTAPGGEFDEGFLLAYPDRVLEGDWPHKDFLTFYGPGSPVSLAGVYGVLGSSVGLERAIGLGVRLLAVVALFVLALPAGRSIAAACGLIGAGVLQSSGLPATAALTALALALLSVALLATALRRPRGERWALAAGLLAGLALLFRVDFLLPAALGALPLLAAVGRPVRVRWLAGLAVGVVLLAAHLLVVGPDAVERVVGDLLRSGSVRRLGPPSPLTLAGLLLVLSVVGAVLLAALGLRRARRGEPAARAALAAALFAAGLAPYVASRADLPHVVPLAFVAVGLAPTALALVPEGRLATLAGRARRLVGPVAAAAGAAMALVGGVALASGDGIADVIGRGSTDAVDIRHGGRSFPVKPEHARDLQAMLDAAERFAQPGDRLFVGGRDLRQSNGSDTVLYWLLDELRPASYYMELNPKSANRRESGLTEELRGADVLVLSTRYDEAPDAERVGDTDAPSVVAELFCPRARSGSYTLLTRCGAS